MKPKKNFHIQMIAFMLHMLRCTYQLLVWKPFKVFCLQYSSYQVHWSLGVLLTVSLVCWFNSSLANQLYLLSFSVTRCVTAQTCMEKTIEQPCTQACECEAEIEDTDICINLFQALAFVPVRNINPLFIE